MARVEAKVKIDYKDYRDFYLYSLMTNKSIKSFLIVFCLALLVSLGLTIFTVIKQIIANATACIALFDTIFFRISGIKYLLPD